MSPAGEAESPRPRAVAFDHDGTLADDLALTFAAFRYACRPFLARELSDAEISAQFGPTQEGIVRALVPDHWREGVPRFLDYFSTRFDDYVEPLSGIDDLLSAARGCGLHTAIVTGAGEASVAVTLSRLGLRECVDRVLVGQPQGSRKTRQLGELAAEWGLLAEEMAYVGDAASDMIAAGDAGALPLGAAWTATANVEVLRRAGAREVFVAPAALSKWLSEKRRSPEVQA